MEPFLLKMDHTDQTTKHILQSLINKKLKYNRYKNAYFILFSSSLLFSLFAFFMMYRETSHISYTVFDAFSTILNKDIFLYLLFIAFVLLGSVKIVHEKKEKLEKEFHDLRCEIIDKSKDLWKNDNWHKRHIVFEYMKKKYDINLYHESK